MSLRKWPVLGGVLAVLWLFVRGVPADPSTVLGEVLLGLAVGLPVAALFSQLYTDRTRLGRNLRAAPYAVLYVATFLWELATANVDVAYRVLAPSMPIEPVVIVIPLRVERDGAVTTIANSISLTPGTLSMDHDPETNALYVHAIDGRTPASVVAPVRRWEDYALVIFDEENQPGDPAPEPARTADGTLAERDRWRGESDD
jgi:multicomponent Na+:H+ antiporter subunit E